MDIVLVSFLSPLYLFFYPLFYLFREVGLVVN
nr:MAG TPA: hypothetical protein [Caudoviricetes sp.]